MNKKKEKRLGSKPRKIAPPPRFAPVVALGLICAVLFFVGGIGSLRGTLAALTHTRSQGTPLFILAVASSVANTMIHVAVIYGGIGLIRRSERARRVLVGALGFHIVSLLWSGVNMARAMPIAASIASSELAEALQGNEGAVGVVFFVVGVLPMVLFSATLLVLATRKFVSRNMGAQALRPMEQARN